MLVKGAFDIRIFTFLILFLLKLCSSSPKSESVAEFESKITESLIQNATKNGTNSSTTFPVTITNYTDIIIVKLDSEVGNGNGKNSDLPITPSKENNDTLKTEETNRNTAHSQGIQLQDSPSNSYPNENHQDIMKEYFGENSGITTGKGASGPLYVCGYVGGEDNENDVVDDHQSESPQEPEITHKIQPAEEPSPPEYKPQSHVQLFPITNNNNNYKFHHHEQKPIQHEQIHKPFIPSPEITHNVIQYEEAYAEDDYYGNSGGEEEEPDYNYHHHYDHSSSSGGSSSDSNSDEHNHSGGCDGWKVVYHPMSRIYPFKYKNPKFY